MKVRCMNEGEWFMEVSLSAVEKQLAFFMLACLLVFQGYRKQYIKLEP